MLFLIKRVIITSVIQICLQFHLSYLYTSFDIYWRVVCQNINNKCDVNQGHVVGTPSFVKHLQQVEKDQASLLFHSLQNCRGGVVVDRLPPMRKFVCLNSSRDTPKS